MEEEPRTGESTPTDEIDPVEPVRTAQDSRRGSGGKRRIATSRRGRATRRRHPTTPCLNCGDPREGQYCPQCGQKKIDVLVSVRVMIADELEDEFVLNRRLPRTLFALFFQPGFLTLEYINGRIASYARPLKLYLVSSLVFFLLLSFFTLRLLASADLDPDRVVEPGSPEDLAALDSALAAVNASLADPDLSPMAEFALNESRRVLEANREAALAAAGAGETPATDLDVVPIPRPRERTPTIGELINLEAVQQEGRTVVNTGMEPLDSVLVRRVREIADMTPRQAVERLLGAFLQYVPMVMFVLLPLFALVLKLLYVRRHRYYAEHFVFLLHVHAFIYLIFTLMLVTRGVFSLPGWLVLALFGWTALYILLAMKRVYGQPWHRTLGKYVALGFTYMMMLLVSVPVLLFVSFLLF